MGETLAQGRLGEDLLDAGAVAALDLRLGERLQDLFVVDEIVSVDG